MANIAEKWEILAFLRGNTLKAAAYYMNMTARNQRNRMNEQTFRVCEALLCQYITPEKMEIAKKMNSLEEQPFYETIVAEARRDLFIDKEPTWLESIAKRAKAAFEKEKQPNKTRDGIQKQLFNNTAQIFMHNYSKSPALVAEYTRIAKKDFPELKDDDIEVVIFGGISKKGSMGIRFRIPKNAKRPGDYYEFFSPESLDELIY